MTSRRHPVDVLMARHGWDGYAAVTAWVDVHRRGRRSPWWPEVNAAIGACLYENLTAAMAPVAETTRALTAQMAAATPQVAAMFGRLAKVPVLPHPTVAINAALPRLATVARAGARPAFTIQDEITPGDPS